VFIVRFPVIIVVYVATFLVNKAECVGAGNARLKNAASNCRNGKCRTGKGETELQDWKSRFPTVHF